MIVVADSGSTKTEWRLAAANGHIEAVQTGGLNPLASDRQTTLLELKNSELNNWLAQPIAAVYFYGAGIVDNVQQEIVENYLRQVFKSPTIVVQSDLFGAARAVFGDEPGLIGILGTGSNSALYNGQAITKRIPALGYILADEGSGAVLGGHLLKHFLRGELPESISEAFKAFYPQHPQLIETVYAKKHAARFLASFMPFIYAHKEEEFVRKFLLNELQNYINLLSRYQGKHKIGIVGSVGFQFQNEINYLAKSADLHIVDYLKNPIDKLTNYHLSKSL